MKRQGKRIAMAVVAFGMALGFGVIGGPQTESKAAEVAINAETFTDPGVLSSVNMIDYNKDGILTDDEAAKMTYLYFGTVTSDIPVVLKYFPNIKEITIKTGSLKSVTVNNKSVKTITVISDTNGVFSLVGAEPSQIKYYAQKATGALNFKGVKGYTKVTDISVFGKKVTRIAVPNQTKLKKLVVKFTSITKMDTSKCTKLESINLSNNKIKSLDLKKNKKLTTLACYDNKLTSLSISANTKLKDIGVSDNKLTKLDTTKNKKINRILAENNRLKSLKVGSSKKIKELTISNNKLSNLDLKKFAKLETLRMTKNKVKVLNVSKNKNLTCLYCAYNPIKKLSLSNNKNLTYINVAGTSIKKLSLKNQKKLSYITVGKKYDLIKDFKLSTNNKLENGNTMSNIMMCLTANKTYDLKKMFPALQGYTFECYSQKMTVTPDGQFTMPSWGKNEYIGVTARKDKDSVYLSLNTLGEY